LMSYFDFETVARNRWILRRPYHMLVETAKKTGFILDNDLPRIQLARSSFLIISPDTKHY